MSPSPVSVPVLTLTDRQLRALHHLVSWELPGFSIAIDGSGDMLTNAEVIDLRRRLDNYLSPVEPGQHSIEVER